MTQINNIPPNLCSRFLLPLLQLNNIWLSKSTKKRRRLVNCFITTEIDDSEFRKEDRLYMLIQTHDYERDYEKEFDKIITNQYCCGVWELDMEYTLIAFNMSYIEDYYKFIEGKYSEYSEKGKYLCINSPFSCILLEGNLVPVVQHIFNKQDERKQYIASLFSIPLHKLENCELAPVYYSTTEPIGTNILNKYILDILNINLTIKS
jgi:hypothetical protein